jgi:NTP pyrophosphatase (non-canonical NTP hydrolase)
VVRAVAVDSRRGARSRGTRTRPAHDKLVRSSTADGSSTVRLLPASRRRAAADRRQPARPRGRGAQGVQQCLLLGEEVGELFKAVRKQQNLTVDPQSRVGDVEEELADVLIYLCAIANRLDIDLEDAFRRKEQRNEQRVWS